MLLQRGGEEKCFGSLSLLGGNDSGRYPLPGGCELDRISFSDRNVGSIHKAGRDVPTLHLRKEQQNQGTTSSTDVPILVTISILF